MVNKNQSKVSTLRSKLVAAIAMLLVGAFMVVSSSYAWFTLSTAPEVTGIYTSVGANGNLEMALLPNGGLTAIQDGVGTTGNNEAWGNLVDLGQTTGNQNKYGLDLISLMPARLNTKNAADDSGYTYAFNGLQSVSYGADGRPNADLVNAVAGKYSSDSGAFEKIADEDATIDKTYGVTAYGSASGMSAQQKAYIQYRKAMESDLSDAQAKAQATFKNYGNALAEVVMTKAMQGNGATFNIVFVPDMIDALELANQDIIDAIENYVAAGAAIALFDADDTAWSSVVSVLSTLDLSNVTIAEGQTELTIDGISKPIPLTPSLKSAINQYNAIKEKLVAADTAIASAGLTWTDTVTEPEVEGGEAVTTEATPKATTWEKTSAILFTTGILNYDEIQVNGKTTEEIQAMMGDNFDMNNIPDDLMNFGVAFASNGEIAFTSGSGVHADIADIAGEYQSSISVTLSFNGLSFTNPNVRLRTVVDSGIDEEGKPTTARIDMTQGLSSPADNNNAGTKKLLTEFYGYQLDFAFRTNAQNSKLQLQTDAIGRIYSEDGSDTTMGHGSTMTFTVPDNNFTEVQAKTLMTTVRIVFMDGAGNIVGLGLLEQDVENGTYVTGANGEITSNIYLYDFTINETSKKLDVVKKADSAELMDLNQNTATKLSVLVYMDGDIVDNSMVAAEATASLNGSLNLQFSSSADLKPMDYTEFKGTTNND